MVDIIKELQGIGMGTVIIVLALIIVLIPKAIESWRDLLNSLGLISKKQIKEVEGENTIKELQEQIISVNQQIEEVRNNITYNEQQALNVHEKIYDDIYKTDSKITDIQAKLDSLLELIVDMQKKNDSSERARLKDRISQLYRHYHTVGKWNHMESEAFKDLIIDFENRGEYNTFVHEICEPESHTWEVIDE